MRTSDRRRDYVVYTIIAVAIVLILGFLFLTKSGIIASGDSVGTEDLQDSTVGQVSVKVLPPGTIPEDTNEEVST